MNRRRLVAALGTAVVMVGASACSGGGSGGAKSSATSFEGRKLVVWLMAGDDLPSWMASVKAQFEQQYPGATVDFKTQQWTGIQATVTDALSNMVPPDILDIGNTQTAYYASTGGLMDLDKYRTQLGGADWTPSMNKSTLVGGKQFAAPWYAGPRAVMYNKKLWNRAGLTPPTTMAQWLTDLAQLKQTSGVKSALYLPGQNWYAFDGFLQDAGADVLTEQNGRWVGDLGSPQALQAAQLFKKLNSFGTAPVDQDEGHPLESSVFAKGDVASMIAMGYEENAVVKDNPGMAGDIGWFPIPGDTPGKPAKTFFGGSNLAVAQNSANPDLALGLLKIALNDTNESAFAKQSGFLPNKATLYPALKGNAYAAAASQEAADAGFTPLVPNWGNVENTPNPITDLFLTPILQGKDPQTAAAAADAKLAARLGQG
ncbi:N,N'-diacetylchitobiose transport system substrate-binding protein [Streptomyces sp. 846.5]|nr:extracellular solute-binding protein [Streptomyces sp. 846.5]TDU04287.1 N,N'-diacetylchitobiose transport system substrate-binding protein [Streptomyces sp. 846.5]